MTEACATLNERVSQGDIYKNIEYIESVVESQGVLEISKIVFPYVIVLTQDCDLSQDYNFRLDDDLTDDKLLVSVLLAPLYVAETVYAGEHLSDLNRKMRQFNIKKGGKLTTEANFLLKNEIPRYHYLSFDSEIRMAPSIIDFKHYFTVNVEYLYSIRENNFVCSLTDLYKEDVSQRFSSYLSRIGLP